MTPTYFGRYASGDWPDLKGCSIQSIRSMVAEGENLVDLIEVERDRSIRFEKHSINATTVSLIAAGLSSVGGVYAHASFALTALGLLGAKVAHKKAQHYTKRVTDLSLLLKELKPTL